MGAFAIRNICAKREGELSELNTYIQPCLAKFLFILLTVQRKKYSQVPNKRGGGPNKHKSKKNSRKYQAQFREKLRKLRLRQNYGFLIKNTV